MYTDNHQARGLNYFNAFAVGKTWEEKFTGKLIHLFCDNDTAVNIFQVGWDKDTYIQACARQPWLICASYDITLAVGHIADEWLTSSADALSHWPHEPTLLKTCRSLN